MIMRDLHQITTQAELEELIGRYFEGETTLEEENAMRQVLAHCPWSSDTIDEALFAMGYFSAHSNVQRQATLRTTRQRVFGIAASIAIILAVGGFALWHQHTNNDLCVAYVNGETIHNDEDVMALIQNDLNMVGDASQGMAAQLSSLGEALEIDNN